MYNLCHHADASLATGAAPLETLISKMRSSLSLMSEYGQEGTRSFYALVLQFALILIGPAEDPTELTGEVIVESEARENSKRTGNAALSQFLEHYCLQLAYYFGDYELAGKFSRRTENFGAIVRGHFLVPRNVFFRGLTALAEARQTTGRRRWRKVKRAANLTRQMRNWSKGGNANCVHMLQLLEAETASLTRRDPLDAKRKYERAIQSSGRTGYLNDKALAHELAFTFHLRCARDECCDNNNHDAMFWAQNHYADAVQAYADWNAYEKVRDLVRGYGPVLDPLNLVGPVACIGKVTVR
jgi:hypothetical protein